MDVNEQSQAALRNKVTATSSTTRFQG